MSATPAVTAAVHGTSHANSRAAGDPKRRQFLDSLTVGTSMAGGIAIIVLVLLMAGVLVYGAWPAIVRFGFSFLVTSEWDPNPDVLQFGALAYIYGTVVSALIALAVAVPVSIGSAIFLVRLAPRWMVGPCSFMIELLAAIPSIAYGFWGVAVLVPFLQKSVMPVLKGSLGQIPVLGKLFEGSSGYNMLAAGIVMAIMITPIITAVTREVLRAIPRELDEGAYALGATWWQATLVILNFGKIGIFGAIMLGLARAVGETMAVTMVIGNNNNISASLLKPAQTMASALANNFLNGDVPERQALTYVAVVLLFLTFIMNMVARWLINSTIKPGGMFGAFQRKPRVEATPASVADAGKVGSASSPAEPVVHRKIPIASSNPVVRLTNKIMVGACVACSILTLTLLGMIIGFVFFKGISSINLDFFTQLPGVGEHTGMRNCIIGTLILIGLGSTFGIPLGMLCGVYLSEYSNNSRLSHVVRLLVDVLAGTPSIIIGVLVYTLVVKPMETASGLAGGIALGFMMCPIIAKTTEEMLRLVPPTFREASMALGGAKYHSLFKVIIPAASTGIITGIMLAVARIAGETAPLLFTAQGNNLDVYQPLKPFPSLTLKIFEYATSAEDDWQRQAWAGMLVLISVILILSATVRYVTRTKMAAAR